MYQKRQSYEVQFLIYEVGDNFLSFCAILCPFPPSNPEAQDFEKMKKPLGDNTISLSRTCSWHDKFIVLWTLNIQAQIFLRILLKILCTINDNHMISGSWDMKCNKQNFFVILGYFLRFYPLTAQKIKIS